MNLRRLLLPFVALSLVGCTQEIPPAHKGGSVMVPQNPNVILQMTPKKP